MNTWIRVELQSGEVLHVQAGYQCTTFSVDDVASGKLVEALRASPQVANVRQEAKS